MLRAGQAVRQLGGTVALRRTIGSANGVLPRLTLPSLRAQAMVVNRGMASVPQQPFTAPGRSMRSAIPTTRVLYLTPAPPAMLPRAPGAAGGARRGFTAGAAARGVAMFVGRIIVLPTALFTAVGTAVNEAKKSIPDVDLGILGEIGTGVAWIFDSLSKEAKNMRDALSSEGSSSRQSPQQGGNPDQEKATTAAAAVAAPTDAVPVEPGERTYTHEELLAALKQQAEEMERENTRVMGELKDQITQLRTEFENAQEGARKEILEQRHMLQQEIDALKAENKELRRIMVLDSAKSTTGGASESQRAIDLFSDILDLRSRVDSAFNAQDHLPRVVVVGDQSAGKTSVLEVVVGARIFPRGAGDMMTRSPIQVTLSESAHHTAQIKGADRIYNLHDEAALKDLRREIERRMLGSLKGDEVVSSQAVSLDVRGPGLRPMVLVDLPGIIQHHTRGMPESTKGSILKMCSHHIENPNSIILCVQDASRDAEGSSVADIVRSADPSGERTIFVLTKVDMAESLKFPAQKLRAILKGQKFNMQAKAYFAVITGTANPDASVEDIRRAEKDYFDTSAFFKEGVFSARFMGTDNLSRAVSEAFWERVKDTVSHEAREITLALKKKENEFKNTFPGQPRMSRDDLFGMGRAQILQNVSKFNATMTAAQWESVLSEQIWERVGKYVIDTVYMEAAADTEDAAAFKTNVENLLDSWVSQDLPELSVDVARQTLIGQFLHVLNFTDTDGVYDRLREEVRTRCVNAFVWDPRSVNKVRSVQELMLRDDVIKDRKDWDKAVHFMVGLLDKEHKKTLTTLQQMKGPSTLTQWTKWTRQTQEQKVYSHIITELQLYFSKHSDIKSGLNAEEVKAVKHNLSKKYNLDVSQDMINTSYRVMFKEHFLDKSLKSAAYCQSKFGYTSKDVKPCNSLCCYDILLFWRVHNMLAATSNMLRLEAMEYKKHLEEEVREVLDKISVDKDAKQRLITGRRVTVSEEIEVLRHIQYKLDNFIKQLKKEGRSPP